MSFLPSRTPPPSSQTTTFHYHRHHHCHHYHLPSSSLLHRYTWDLANVSCIFASDCSADSCAQPAHCPTTETRSESAGGVDVEVQICNLRDLYDKKTKKTPNGFEYRLENTRVTIIARASVQLQSLQVFVRRCPDAAIKTHDTIGEWGLRLRASGLVFAWQSSCYCPIV